MRLPRSFPGMDALDANTVYLMGCRGFDQFCCTVRSLIDPTTFCPFCEAELDRRQRRPISENAAWRLLENEFSHKNTRRMLLAVPKPHITDIRELDWSMLGGLIASCGVKSGGIVMRFGDPHLNVGSVEHLHVNIIEPVCGKEYRPPLAKNAVEHAEDYSRLLGLVSSLSDKGGVQWLFSAAGIIETQPKVA